MVDILVFLPFPWTKSSCIETVRQLLNILLCTSLHATMLRTSLPEKVSYMPFCLQSAVIMINDDVEICFNLIVVLKSIIVITRQNKYQLLEWQAVPVKVLSIVLC